MLSFFLSLLLGLGLPWGLIRRKDRRAGRIITLNRPRYLGWLLGSMALGVLGGYVGYLYMPFGSGPGTEYGMALAFSYIATRRLRDIGLSPRIAILGLAPPLAFMGALVLCFVPTEVAEKRDWE